MYKNGENEMKEETLVEKAKKAKTRGYFIDVNSKAEDELLDLAIAYANREISITQANIAVYGENKKTSNLTTKLNTRLMTAIRHRRVQIRKI